jgi:hypothetical protein
MERRGDFRGGAAGPQASESPVPGIEEERMEA